MIPKTRQTTRRVYRVSELTSQIKILLEERFDFVWITGEISNFGAPASGHFYFTLKDESAQISAVMFRGQNRNLTFRPEDGMEVTGLGRIGVYEPRGAYQIILEYLEPRGAGSLQKAFEQLKNRLADEGLFDERHKKPIPFLPRKIGVVTSGTGAVVHDILNVTARRFPNMAVDIVPVKVQGEGAAAEITAGIELLNRRGDADVILLARGGGSLEDLQAFNSEPVARSIFASRIPVISGVGHETDYTIADFTADLRAPTPSAAAELAVPSRADLSARCAELEMRLTARFRHRLGDLRKQTAELERRLIHPRRRVEDLRLRLEEMNSRLSRWKTERFRREKERLNWRTERLTALSPVHRLGEKRLHLSNLQKQLTADIRRLLDARRSRWRERFARLELLNPHAMLSRGYSIAMTMPEKQIIREAESVRIGQQIDVKLASGVLHCRIEDISHDSKKDL